MKICWLVADDYWGGVFPVSLEICRQARLSGHDCQLLLVCKPAHAALAGLDIPIESLHLTPDDPEAPAAILGWLAKHEFDVVVLNCCGEADTIPPYLPESIRCVYVVHNSPRKYWVSAVRHASQIDLIVAISDYVAGIVRPHLESPKQLVTVRNGSSYPTPVHSHLERSCDVLYTGGDELRKGAGDLLKVWKELVAQGFAGRIHWCGAISSAFKSRINALPAQDQIVFYGRVPREKIFRLANHCRALLMLSRAEAFGMITIEAMSMGCIPVAWDIRAGTKEIAEAGIHGFFVPIGDYQAFAKTVMEANKKHPSMAPAAISRARETFSAKHAWSDYEQNLKDVLNHPRRMRPLAGRKPPKYTPPLRPSRLLPSPFRTIVKEAFHKYPKVAHLLNNYTGM